MSPSGINKTREYIGRAWIYGGTNAYHFAALVDVLFLAVPGGRPRLLLSRTLGGA